MSGAIRGRHFLPALGRRQPPLLRRAASSLSWTSSPSSRWASAALFSPSSPPLSRPAYPIHANANAAAESSARGGCRSGSALQGSPPCWAASASRHRSYVTRAHPQLIKPEVRGIRAALARVLEDAAHRQRCRDRKAIRNHNRNKEGPSSTATAPAAAAASSAGPSAAAAAPPSSEAPGPALKVVDETIELALNLNLDPRKPNQSLRGSVDLPHGSGKAVNCLVFTSDPDGAASLREQFQQLQSPSASSARVEVGGEDLVDRILAGEVSVERFERGLATPDMQKLLGQRLARILGPRGLMPNPKAGTLVEGLERLREALGSQVRGRSVPYRTDREGVVHVRLGRASFGADALVENAGAVLKEIFKAKPGQYGKSAKKGKKSAAGKNAKYLLRATVTSTQGKGYSVDVRTLDPTSPFFLNRIEGEEEAEAASPPAEEASREPAAAA